MQIALSILLVAAAGLFLRSLNSLTHAPLGFTPEPLIVADLDLQMSSVKPEERQALLQRMTDAVDGVPGVTFRRRVDDHADERPGLEQRRG